MALSDNLTMLHSGTSVEKTVSLADYSSSEYDLSYVLRGELNILEVNCSTNSDGSWTFALSTDQTQGLPGGFYSYVGYVESNGTKEVADTGNIQVIADPTQITWAQSVLKAIKANIENRADDNQLTVSIAGTQLQYMSADQLIRWRDYFKAEVDREHQRMQRDLGNGSGRFLYTEFR